MAQSDGTTENETRIVEEMIASTTEGTPADQLARRVDKDLAAWVDANDDGTPWHTRSGLAEVGTSALAALTDRGVTGYE